MMDNGSDDENEDLLSGMSDLEKLKQAFTKRKYTQYFCVAMKTFITRSAAKLFISPIQSSLAFYLSDDF